MITLFPDQQRFVADISKAFFVEKHMTVVGVAPTGSGKTVMGAHMAERLVNHLAERMAAEYVKKGYNVLWLTHRVELVDGTNKTMQAFGLDPVLIDADASQPKHDAPFYIAMSQTMRARLTAASPFETIIMKRADFVFIDEAHRTDFCWFFDSGYFGGKRVLGLTATPLFSKKGLFMQDYYSKMVFNAQDHELDTLTEMGRLCPINLVEPEGAAEAVLELEDDKGHGYKKASIKRFRAKIGKAFTGMERAIKQFASGRPTLVFCQDGSHAIETCLKLNESGISARYLLSSVQSKDAKDLDSKHKERYSGGRKTIVNGFKAGHFDVLVNVDLLTTGFDFPGLFCAVIDREAGTLPLYMQIVGRLTRTHASKPFAILIDMTGATRKHGGIYKKRNWSFQEKKETGGGTAPTKTCQFCGVLNHARAEVCRDCGKPFPKHGTVFTDVEMFILQAYSESGGRVPAVSGMGEFETLEFLRDANKHRPGWIYTQIALKHGKDGWKEALQRYAIFKNKPYSQVFLAARMSSMKFCQIAGLPFAGG